MVFGLHRPLSAHHHVAVAVAIACQMNLSGGYQQGPLDNTFQRAALPAGVLPLGDAATATAWAEQPLAGRPGWGLGLFVQPERDGLEVAMAAGRASCSGQQADAGCR